MKKNSHKKSLKIYKEKLEKHLDLVNSTLKKSNLNENDLKKIKDAAPEMCCCAGDCQYVPPCQNGC